jgi:2-polyprenyl-3-methyl-5-hydroxy-6-metoxy-1,4-benzoquinol methylase
MNRPNDDVPADILDPVAAYNRVARFYPEIAKRRKLYLERVDALTVARIPRGGRTLLDVGAGDGKRALAIADKCGLDQVVLLEPSAEMIQDLVGGDARVWGFRAEDLGRDDLHCEGRNRQFDVITCLWNVLGHIRPAQQRAHVLGQLERLLSPHGFLFLDVNHRYNARSYGLLRTTGRFLYDQLLPAASNGDVTVSWNLESACCRTFGHVFTDREIRRLAREAGFTIGERVAVDYDTGQLKRWSWEGNLFYVLRRRISASDSLSVSQTSCTSGSAIWLKKGSARTRSATSSVTGKRVSGK